MKNEFFVVGNEVLIKLSPSKYGTLWTIIDLIDLSKVAAYESWFVRTSEYSKTYYAAALKQIGVNKYVIVRLHRLIFGLTDPTIFIDHDNRNGLDNRRTNIKVASNSINGFNKDLRPDNNSGQTGVSYKKDVKAWRAYITINKKTINLGNFRTKEMAIKVRLRAEKKYFGFNPLKKDRVTEEIKLNNDK